MISKSPQKVGKHQQPIRFFSAARIGFRKILEDLNVNSSDTILLPAYIGITDREGSGVLDPVAAVSAKADFYPVNHRLSGDIDFIKTRLNSGNVKAILVIHYFGISQNDMTAIKMICDLSGTVLIEDCAHSWRSSLDGIPLGEYGDYSFGSIHKYLAAGDGGFAKWRAGNALSGTVSPEEEISIASLIDYASADYPSIATIRNKNYTHLMHRLENQMGIEVMYPALAPGIVPLNFPILVTGIPRERLYFELIERGYTLIALYYRLIPEIDSASFPISHEISQRILNLPVHQDITIEDLDGLVDAMRDILSE